jgi:hypothetical protein
MGLWKDNGNDGIFIYQASVSLCDMNLHGHNPTIANNFAVIVLRAVRPLQEEYVHSEWLVLYCQKGRTGYFGRNSRVVFVRYSDRICVVACYLD